MNRPYTWLNLPCTDPIGRVFARDGRFFRAIYPRKVPLVRSMLAIDNVARLMADGLLAKTWIADGYTSSSELVLEVEAAPFDVPCDRFTTSALQTAFDRWIEISLRLEGTGLALSDAHFGNYMLFGRNEPRWIDLGSLRPVQEVTPHAPLPFRGLEELWKGMAAPLLMLRSPEHARLARLGIADYPYQGPKTVTDEAALQLDAFVAAERTELQQALSELSGPQAILKTYEFVCSKIATAAVRPASLPSSVSLAPPLVRDVLTKNGARRVACLGGDVYMALASSLAGFDTVVVDEDKARLEAVAAALKAQPASTGTVALYLEHVVNRRFLRQPPAADTLVAVDPFQRFQHDSEVMLENIAAILAALAGRLAVITAPQQYSTPLAQLLRGFFAQVTEEPAGADQITLVCRKSND